MSPLFIILILSIIIPDFGFFSVDSLTVAEKTAKDNYIIFFRDALQGGDVSAQIDSHVAIVASLGANTTLHRTFVSSTASMIASFKPSPTDAEKALVKQITEQNVKDVHALTTSLPGLKNVLTDAKLKSKPENREYYQMIQEFDIVSNDIIANPAYGYELVNGQGDLVATKYAHYLVVTEEFNKRNQVSGRIHSI
jgi:hypothetical protein